MTRETPAGLARPGGSLSPSRHQPIRQHGSIKRAEAAELCRTESVQARRLLARMVKAQILVQQGEKRGVEYVKGPKL